MDFSKCKLVKYKNSITKMINLNSAHLKAKEKKKNETNDC